MQPQQHPDPEPIAARGVALPAEPDPMGTDEEVSDVFRAYAARDLVAQLEPRPTSEAEFRALVRRFVLARRAAGDPPERILIALKRLVVGAAHRLRRDRFTDSLRSRYLGHVMRWAVEDHVARWIVEDYFGASPEGTSRASPPAGA